MTHTTRPARSSATWLLALLIALIPALAPGVAVAASSASVTASVTGYTTINPMESTTLRATYTKNGEPVAAATLRLQKKISGTYQDVRTFIVTDGVGTTTLSPNSTTRYRVVNHDGSSVSASFKVTVLDYYVNAELTGPATIASTGSTTIEVDYVKPDGPVPAATLSLQKLYSSGWTTVKTFTVTDGEATLTLEPNRTTDYRVVNYNASAVSRTIGVTVKDPLPTSFTIEGSGFGHGVGMPQYGAYGAAKDGMTSTEILEYFYTDTNVSTRDTKKSIAVQILGPDPYSFSGYGDSRTSTTFRVLDDANWRIRDANDLSSAIEGTDSVTLSVDGTQVTADDGTQSVTAATLKIFWSGTRDWDGNGEDGVARLGGAQGEYRHGYFTVSVIDGKLNVVNILLLNTEYLYGLAEMPSSWGLNGGKSALAAQAIAGRSYALTKAETRKDGCDCHVVDDVRDQNFTGWEKENEGDGYYGAVWVSAVDATVTSSTRAKVLTYDGDPIQTHYYSSSGGYTADSEDVWSSVVPWERSVRDPWSRNEPSNSLSSWTRTLSQSNAAALFGLDDVRSIAVTAKWTGGLARELTATSDTGETATISGKADWIRSTLSKYTSSSMPAAWITDID